MLLMRENLREEQEGNVENDEEVKEGKDWSIQDEAALAQMKSLECYEGWKAAGL